MEDKTDFNEHMFAKTRTQFARDRVVRDHKATEFKNQIFLEEQEDDFDWRNDEKLCNSNITDFDESYVGITHNWKSQEILEFFFNSRPII